MDFSYKQAPLFRLTLAFIAGVIIAIANIHLFQFSIFIIVLTSVLTVSFLGTLVFRNSSYRNRWVFGTSASVLMTTLGMLTVFIRTDKLKSDHISQLRDGRYPFVVQIIEGPQEKVNSYKFLVKTQCVRLYGDCEPKSGKMLLYLPKDSAAAQLKYGDRLVGEGNITSIDWPKNPGEFNYKQYMDYQQVQKQVILKERQWKLLERNKGNPIKAFVYRLRYKMLNILYVNGIGKESFGVASALILGYKDALDGDTIKAYVGAGAVHVLAVSGLHVGVIYLIIMFLLKPVGRGKRAAMIRVSVIIVFLLLYGMLTGMPPSVSRAIVMFACIAVAKSFRFQTNIYNTLAFSALLVTFIDPYAVMQVGFQLSYLAVAGISYLYPRLYAFWVVPNRIVNWLWQITCVSIAAQVATFPLVLFYFHQFAIYSLLSGPIVILGATIVIWLGLVLFLTSWLPVLPVLFAAVLDYTIHWMNWCVSFVEGLPFSQIKEIDITLLETWLIYVGIVFLLIWLSTARVKWLLTFLSIVLIIGVSQLNEAIMQSKQRMFIVYSVPKGTMMSFVAGRKAYVFGDRDLYENESKMKYHIKPHWWQLGINEIQFSIVDSLQRIPISSQEINLALIGSDGKYREILNLGNETNKTLLLYGNPEINVGKLLKLYDFQKVLFDASNSYENLRRWTHQCDRLGVEYYNLDGSGAYLLDLKEK